MKNQDPLIDPSNTNFPSPQFQSRPGWGGQSQSWLSKNPGKLILRVVILVLVIWGITALFNSDDTNVVVSPTPTSSNQGEQGSYSQTAQPGDGLSNLAARALDAYLADHSDIKLVPIEHAWAINRLTNTMLSISSTQIPASPKAGEVVDFPGTAIDLAIKDAQALTPSQRRNLEASLR